MERKGRNLVMSTGREILANDGIIGLRHDPDSNSFTATEGYDSLPLIGYASDKDDPDVIDQWTHEERMELADFMIEQWEKFKRADARAACSTSGHQWSRWIYSTAAVFSNPLQRFRDRTCRRCESYESVPISESDFQSASMGRE